MSVTVNTTDFYRTINFFKKKSSWATILETAANNVAPGIEDSARELAYSHFQRVTGGLGNSITAMAERGERGDTVDIVLSSNHPAAGLIEYGGYVQGIGRSDRLRQYAQLYGMNTHALKTRLESTQPFLQPHPFLRPALIEGRGAIEGEILRVAHRLKP